MAEQKLSIALPKAEEAHLDALRMFGYTNDRILYDANTGAMKAIVPVTREIPAEVENMSDEEVENADFNKTEEISGAPGEVMADSRFGYDQAIEAKLGLAFEIGYLLGKRDATRGGTSG